MAVVLKQMVAVQIVLGLAWMSGQHGYPMCIFLQAARYRVHP